ncbi:MAG TPA: ornithine cyclodeaminase family protein, partial [Dehalococcoidia bacterium]|nr:ornithine cyclodeaminase family protein [Dehalococcoidia bacterium]
GSPQEAIEDVDIIQVATNTGGRPDPVAFRGEWMFPGVHVNSIASTMPKQREVDGDTFLRADRIAFDSKAHVEEESGDVIVAKQEGKYDSSKVWDLKEMVAGKVPSRTGDQEITLYKSVGTALQDVAAGYAVYQKALSLSLGKEIGEFLDVKGA